MFQEEYKQPIMKFSNMFYAKLKTDLSRNSYGYNIKFNAHDMNARGYLVLLATHKQQIWQEEVMKS